MTTSLLSRKAAGKIKKGREKNEEETGFVEKTKGGSTALKMLAIMRMKIFREFAESPSREGAHRPGRVSLGRLRPDGEPSMVGPRNAITSSAQSIFKGFLRVVRLLRSP
jgi:hypothetical protein